MTNLNDSGAGSLRQAILNSNSGSNDIIVFSVAGFIELDDRLPDITSQVTIDGTSVPGYAGQPLVTLNGDDVSSGAGLTIASTGAGSVINASPSLIFQEMGYI